MYLKSIEIQGFKSFANKIIFEFHNGITAIVGPNGSGKSNVADAVRWVLGEQRIKQLRGSNMQDVIFSGTETRKPQGFAYVAITLDNSDHKLPVDYNEVTVSRRVYRSGESEYKINGGNCRLKDINELFYDTGIGKEGYSIIGQGQIDRILNGKPEERRELFDEAAGIVKFKRRKAVAQKKLEDEKQNLVRVNDILAELEKQVGPLEKQSETAKNYLKLKEELKIYDANLFLLESGAVKELLKDTADKLHIVEEDKKEASETASKLKASYEEAQAYLNRLETEIEEKRQKLNELQVRKGSLEGRINVLHEQIHTEEMNGEHIQKRMQTIQEELQQKEKERTIQNDEKSSLESGLIRLKEACGRSQSALEEKDRFIKALEIQLEQAKGGIIEALNEKASLNAKQQRYETMLEQVMVRKSEIVQKLLKFKSDESVQEEGIAALEADMEAVRENVKELTEAQALREKDLEETEKNIRRFNLAINEKQQQYHTALTKLDSLKNIAERYDGYGSSIRKVMEVRDRVHGIRGVVADLIQVEKQYETAIETALGGSIQNIVTDSDQTAKQLIEYLKKNKFGRATFLPLTSIGNRNSFQQPAVLKEPGVLGLANELVKSDGSYAGLMKYLLGRVVVVDHIENALLISKKYQYSLRIVTLDGELFNAGGSMTGGAFRNTSNLLGRKREIEELEEECKKLQLQSAKLSDSLQMEEKNLISVKKLLEGTKESLQEAYLRKNILQMNLSQTMERKREIIESYQDLEREHSLLEQQLRDISANRNSLNQNADSLEEKQRFQNEEVDQLTRTLEERKAEREERSKELTDQQAELSSLTQREAFIRENISRVCQEIGKLTEESEGLVRSLEQSRIVIEAKKEEIEEISGQITQEAARKDEIEAQIREKTRKKDEKSLEQKGFFEKREEISQRLSLLDKESFRLEGQQDKLKERLENFIHYMWNEYEITLVLAEELQREDLQDSGKIKKEIDRIKSQIKAMGNVNVNAIEDYKEVLERYTFLKTHHDDLIEAEKALTGIIEELDTGMRRQFEEKFQEIRKEFDKVFKELFGGGRGTLELMEDGDILEAGVQIISQPPGKKLQNMMQLSGGEKALTAIALLFAIQNLKPSPFCLLDEIEAALDDSNVGRFAGYLHKLTENTQFIVITHRRGTMVASDRLYGITMQEKGVSALVSVNLIEDELDQ